MRAFILYLVISVLTFNYASGQTRIQLDGSMHIDTARWPLVIVDTFKTQLNYLVLNPNEIASIDVLKDSAAISKFGQAGKFGVILIHPKDGTKLLQIAEILRNYNVSDKDKKLDVYVDKVFMKNPKLLLIEQSELDDVQVIIPNKISGDRFINIRTRANNKKGL